MSIDKALFKLYYLFRRKNGNWRGLVMEIKSIQTKKIYKNIVEQIIMLIREGSIKSGDRLPSERTLAEMFDVSRASLREALSVMEIVGIIDIRPGEGSFVSDLNVLPFISLILPLLLKEGGVEEDLQEFRRLLEIGGIKLAIINIDNHKDLLDEMEDILLKMEENIDDVDMGAKLDIRFHQILYEMSDNSVLLKVQEYVGFILEKTVSFNRSLILKDSKRAEGLLKWHRAVFEAVKSRDIKGAQDALEKHFQYTQLSKNEN